MEGWATKANDVKYQDMDLTVPSDGKQSLLYFLWIIEDFAIQDKQYDGCVNLGYERLTDDDVQRIFGPFNSGIFFEINAHAVGDENTLLAIDVYKALLCAKAFTSNLLWVSGIQL